MTTWLSNRDFEDEMMDIQPDCDMIYGKAEEKNLLWHSEITTKYNLQFDHCLPHECPDEIIEAKVRNLAMRNKTKPVKHFNEENYELFNSDNNSIPEAEIRNMIRNCGIESAIHGRLDSKKTLPTIKNNKKLCEINGKKNLIFLDESYFEFLPKKKINTPTVFEEKKNNLIHYYEKLKLYTPREIYNKKKNLTLETTLTTKEQSSVSSSSTASSA